MPRLPRAGMLAASKVVHCRFTSSELAILDRLASSHGMDRSGTIRVALELLDKESTRLLARDSSHARPPESSPSKKARRLVSSSSCRVCERVGFSKDAKDTWLWVDEKMDLCVPCASIISSIEAVLNGGEKHEGEILEILHRRSLSTVSAPKLGRVIEFMISENKIQRMPGGRLALQQALPFDRATVATRARTSTIVDATKATKKLVCRGNDGACGGPICVQARALGLALCDDHFWAHADQSRPWLGGRDGHALMVKILRGLTGDTTQAELKTMITIKGTEALDVAIAALDAASSPLTPAVRMNLSRAGYVPGVRAADPASLTPRPRARRGASKKLEARP